MKQERKENRTNGIERSFSIELRSKGDLKNVSLADGSDDRVLVEGSLGELVQATFAEGIVLEVVGRNGVLRMDLAETDISKAQKIPEGER
jgi:hypothetical protein